MISIKYDFPPRARARTLVFLAGSGLFFFFFFLLLFIFVVFFFFCCLLSALRRFLRAGCSLRRSALSPFLALSLPASPSSRGGNPGFNPFPYNFLPMHREKLARNTHAHARTHNGPSRSLFLFLSPSRSRSRSRSLWRSPIIRFHRIFVVRARASGPDTNPPINPVSVWGIRN